MQGCYSFKQLSYAKLLLTSCHHFLNFVLKPDFLLLQEIHQAFHFLILLFELHQLISKTVFFKVTFSLLLNFQQIMLLACVTLQHGTGFWQRKSHLCSLRNIKPSNLY